MTLTQALIAEIEHEAAGTKKMLERVPAEKFDWRPHEKSMTVKSLATHIASLAGWIGMIVNTSYLDFAENKIPKPEINNAGDLVKLFEEGTQKSVEALKGIQDENLAGNWVLKSGDHIILDLPKPVVIRSMAMNHVYHHRAQLSVYLRMLDVPVPGMYGPSADDRG